MKLCYHRLSQPGWLLPRPRGERNAEQAATGVEAAIGGTELALPASQGGALRSKKAGVLAELTDYDRIQSLRTYRAYGRKY